MGQGQRDRETLYEYSLVIVMGSIWLGYLVRPVVAGHVHTTATGSTITWPRSAGSATSASPTSGGTLQNWQSEFLAVGSMAILSVYLRQRGSPESKPVGAPHGATGVEG